MSRVLSWLTVSPWMLQFAANMNAMWTHVVPVGSRTSPRPRGPCLHQRQAIRSGGLYAGAEMLSTDGVHSRCRASSEGGYA
nr:SPW repeat protein [Rhizobium sp. BK399]